MTPSEWGAFWGLAAPLAIAVIAAVVDWVAVWVGGVNGRRVERIAKPAVLVALLGAALTAHAWTPEAQAARPWLVLGLVASLAGDVLLLPPGRFVPGLLAFLVAHVAYLVAFLQLPGEVPWLVVGIVAAAVLVMTVGRVLVRAAAPAGLAGPVAAYLVAITLMAVAATRTGEIGGHRRGVAVRRLGRDVGVGAVARPAAGPAAGRRANPARRGDGHLPPGSDADRPGAAGVAASGERRAASSSPPTPGAQRG